MIVDDLIEKAFCDGYKYAQREFSEKKEKKKRDKKDKISNALMISGGAGIAGGTSLAGISNKKWKKYDKKISDLLKQEDREIFLTELQDSFNTKEKKDNGVPSIEEWREKLKDSYKKRREKIYKKTGKLSKLIDAGRNAAILSVPVLGTGAIMKAVHNKKKKQNKDK